MSKGIFLADLPGHNENAASGVGTGSAIVLLQQQVHPDDFPGTGDLTATVLVQNWPGDANAATFSVLWGGDVVSLGSVPSGGTEACSFTTAASEGPHKLTATIPRPTEPTLLTLAGFALAGSNYIESISLMLSAADTSDGVGTLRLYVGGTRGAADGTLVAEVEVTSGVLDKVSASGEFENPTGLQYVKMTLENTLGTDATVAERSVAFRHADVVSIPAGISVYALAGAGSGGVTLEPDTEALDVRNNVPVGWDEIPGAEIQVVLAGTITADAGPVTIRVYAGGLGAYRSEISGDEILSVEVPMGTTTLDEISAIITKPSVRSYLKVTYECAGACVIDSKLDLYVVPQEAAQGLALSDSVTTVHSGGTEVLGPQWWVNFDRFEAENLSVSLTVRNIDVGGGDSTYRVRIGGTRGALDGTSAVAHAETYGLNDGHVSGATEEIATPSGWQLVTVSAESPTAGEFTGCSIVITGT